MGEADVAAYLDNRDLVRLPLLSSLVGELSPKVVKTRKSKDDPVTTLFSALLDVV